MDPRLRHHHHEGTQQRVRRLASDNTSSNADALVLVTMGILTALLVLFPYLPYLNRLPYYLGVHRLIWREYYRDVHNVHDARMVEGVSPGPAP